MADLVELDLPLSSRSATTVRACAASIAAGAGLSVDDIDDLRLGVNEAISLLTDVDEDEIGDGARLHVRFESTHGEVVVDVTRDVAGDLPAPDLDELARRIMDAVVDEYAVDGAVVRLRKRVPVDAGS